MDTEDLRRFAIVARRGGFAPAAEELGLDPSTLSRRIAGLERAVGARLLHRTTRAMSLTAEGRRLLAAAEAALAALDEARAEIAGAGQGGTVRLTASAAFGERALVPLLPRLRAAHPALSVELILSDAPLDLAAEGIDLALRLGPEPEGPGPVQRLRAVRYRVCAAPGTASVAGPGALSDRPCLRYALPGLRDRWSFRPASGGPIRRIPVSGPLALSSALALRRAALEGLGPALLADWLIAEDLAAGRLVDLLPEWEAAPARFDAALWLLRPGGAADPPPGRVRAVMELLGEAFGASETGAPP